MVVEFAIPFQSAERKPSEVVPNWRMELKVIEVLPKLAQLQKLGYFHSHPQWGKIRGKPQFSDQDKEYISEGDLEIVVAINDAERSVSWRQSKNQLSGTIGKYHITMAGYYKRKKDNKIMKYGILCPYAIGFDYTFE
jgi:hypothetical protein